MDLTPPQPPLPLSEGELPLPRVGEGGLGGEVGCPLDEFLVFNRPPVSLEVIPFRAETGDDITLSREDFIHRIR